MVDKLNEMFLKYFGKECKGLSPIEFLEHENTSITIVPRNIEAFNLKAPIAGSVKPYLENIEVNKTNAAVYRYMIGYVLASKMEDNEQLFLYHMSMAINDGLRQLTKELGNLSNREIIFGTAVENIFRDMEQYAAIEFRIFVKELNDANKN